MESDGACRVAERRERRVEVRARSALHGLHHGGLHPAAPSQHHPQSQKHLPNFQSTLLLLQVMTSAFSWNVRRFVQRGYGLFVGLNTPHKTIIVTNLQVAL